MAQKVYNLIILDASGSMYSIMEQARTGVNETIQTIKQAQKDNQDQMHFISFVSFNTSGTRLVHDRVLASKVVELGRGDYQPGGGTPLYDAIGSSVSNLQAYVEKGDIVLVTIITDGYENASREYSGATIAKMIEDLRKEDWVFTYIGANQDVEKVARSMNINNSLAFESSINGSVNMFKCERKSRANFYKKINRISKGELPQEALGEDFWS